MKPEEFTQLQYGMFIHFGLYSKMARGEWVMNRERIAPPEMEKFARTFQPDHFNADELCQLAVDGGMRYLVFTTMHHDGFRMYDSALSEFNSMKYCGRNFVKEIVDSARKHGLKIALYHSLNNWHDQPDAVAALENRGSYGRFIENTFALNGTGKLYWSALTTTDYELVLAMQMFYTLVSLMGVLLTDLSYTLVDPRVRIDK